MQYTTSYLVLTIAVIFIVQINGKRGCNLYGHSCYGGHGKRSTGIEMFSRSQPSLQLESNSNDYIPLIPFLSSDNQSNNDLDTESRYQLLRIMQQWIENNRPRKPEESYSNEVLKNNFIN